MTSKTPKYDIKKQGTTRYLVGTSYESGEPTSFNVVWANNPDAAAAKTCESNLYSSTTITVIEYGFAMGRYTATEIEEG